MEGVLNNVRKINLLIVMEFVIIVLFYKDLKMVFVFAKKITKGAYKVIV